MLNDPGAIQQPSLNYELVNLDSLDNKLAPILIKDTLNTNSKNCFNIYSAFEINILPSYLENIIINPISNAISYKIPARKLVLNISVNYSSDGKLIMTFSYNKIGIDKGKHSDRIFKLYQTVLQNPGSRDLG
jgi:hypothetical protein